MQAEGPQGRQAGRAVRLDGVGEHDQAGATIVGDDGDGSASGCFFARLRFRKIAGIAATDSNRDSIDRAAGTDTGSRRQRCGGDDAAETLHRARGDRGCDRVLAAGLDGSCHPQHLVAGEPIRGDHRDHAHPAGGHRAGLVEHDGVDGASLLQDLRALDQDSALGSTAGADQQRGRGGQPERARAGDDQHRHGGANASAQ